MAPPLRPLAALALALAAVCVLALSPSALAMQPRLRTFSAGLSQVQITPNEQTLLNYTLSPTGAWGIVNNWWMTGGDRNVFLSFYIDGEATASIVVHVPTACGAGFGDPAPPVNIYSSAYFGKAANTSGYSNKIPVPFQRSIVITFRGDARAHGTVWLWARGVESAPLLPEFGLAIPPTARLEVQQVHHRFIVLRARERDARRRSAFGGRAH
jgi:hypothetical protein